MLGISNIVRFAFPSPPPAQSLSRSLELLFALGAIDEDCELTENIGEKISELPLHPFHAKMLLASIEFECVKEVLSVVALLSVRTIFQIPPGRRQEAARQHRRFQVEERPEVQMRPRLLYAQMRRPSLRRHFPIPRRQLHQDL